MASRMKWMYSSVERDRSVSSIRRMKTPPWWRANNQLNRAVLAPPTWRWPVGLGAKRTRTGSGICSYSTASGSVFWCWANLRRHTSLLARRQASTYTHVRLGLPTSLAPCLARNLTQHRAQIDPLPASEQDATGRTGPWVQEQRPPPRGPCAARDLGNHGRDSRDPGQLGDASGAGTRGLAGS